jgi:hypothetical protein
MEFSDCLKKMRATRGICRPLFLRASPRHPKKVFKLKLRKNIKNFSNSSMFLCIHKTHSRVSIIGENMEFSDCLKKG